VTKIVSSIEEGAAIERILRHCNFWKDQPSRGPPAAKPRQSWKSLRSTTVSSTENALDAPRFLSFAPKATSSALPSLTETSENGYIHP